MAFKEVQDLDCDITTALGGVNKKTGKPNPKQVEGYFLGKKKTENTKSKSGFSYLYILQTPKGNVGVWGKTDLDRKMSSVTAGAMIRITQSGTQETKNGTMYKFKVEQDLDNVIEVSVESEDSNSASSFSAGDDDSSADDLFGSEEETNLDSDDSAVDELPPVRPTAPARPVNAAAKKAEVERLLGSRNR